MQSHFDALWRKGQVCFSSALLKHLTSAFNVIQGGKSDIGPGLQEIALNLAGKWLGKMRVDDSTEGQCRKGRTKYISREILVAGQPQQKMRADDRLMEILAYLQFLDVYHLRSTLSTDNVVSLLELSYQHRRAHWLADKIPGKFLEN